MKVQMQILLFIVCLNISSGLVVALAVPGVDDAQISPPSTTDEYASHFNSSEIAEGWGATLIQGIPIIGDIFSMFQTMFITFQYLIVGFPMFLNWLGDNFIIDAAARAAYDSIVLALYGIFSVSMTILFIEFISGRYFTE